MPDYPSTAPRWSGRERALACLLTTAVMAACSGGTEPPAPPGTAGVQLTPASVEFAGIIGGSAPASQTVAVTAAGGGVLSGLTLGSITYEAGGAGWLTAALSQTTTPATLSLTAVPGSLPAGTYRASVPVIASSAANSPRSVQVSLSIGAALAITTPPVLPGGTLDVAYTQTLSASGGGPPYSWTLDSGQLPRGLSLNASTGILSGAPDALGSFTAGIRVTDGGGRAVVQSFTLEIAPPRSGPFTALSMTVQHACGLTATGRAFCWGRNSLPNGSVSGQLGVGLDVPRSAEPVPVRAPAGVAFAKLSAGRLHTCALTPVGAAWCWGLNFNGMLGDGTTQQRQLPVAVAMPAGVTFISIAAGESHTCALAPNGQAWCWGDNGSGQLGDGTTNARLLPVRVLQPAGVSFTQVIAGSESSCGLDPSGQAWCWGDAALAAGSQTAPDPLTPIAVRQPAGVAFTSLSGSFDEAAAGVTATGQAYFWGTYPTGFQGEGYFASYQATPAPISQPAGLSLTSWTNQLGFMCGRATDERAWCLGLNAWGQLGDGTGVSRLEPRVVASPAGVTFSHVAPGSQSACALATTGQAWCWGYNFWGELGDGSRTTRLAPVMVRQQ